MTEFLVSPDWLKSRLGDAAAKVVDASWYLPAQKRDGKAEFLAAHIPGAVHFDIDAIADRSSNLPHMLAQPSAFSAAVGALGLSERDTIVVYDGLGLFTAPRVWWNLRIFGARDVRILDGGFPAWQRAGYPVEAGEAHPEPATFSAHFDRAAVVDFDRVKAALAGGSATVVDARSAPRFRGEMPEPRPGLTSGHMPGAHNLHYEMLSDSHGRLRPPDEIRKLFQEARVDLSSPVVTTCGSGVTAAVLLFALATLSKNDVALYDGSWTEWGSDPGSPIATGSDG